MIFILVFVFLITCSAGDNIEESSSASSFEVAYQWTFINFTWNSVEEYENAIVTRKYIPENNAMAGIKFYKNKIYIAMPRVRKGAPITLGCISTDNATKTNPLITPFPTWQMNEPTDCTKLHNVQSMEIDKNGTMWVIDGLRSLNTTTCPPKLVLFDLNNNAAVLQSYSFPEQICLNSGGFLNDLVVDDTDGDYAYITDHSPIDPGLITFSRRQNRAWKIRDASMFPETNATNYDVGGHKFISLSPIDGIALSPRGNGTRFVYYCALTGLNLYSISTDILKDEARCLGSSWRSHVKNIGKKQGQSDGLVVDNKGDLYYGLLPLYGVGKWSINEPFSKAKIVYQNENMIWTDSFAFDDQGFLYLLTNNMHKYFDFDYKVVLNDEVMFTIWKLLTSTQSYLY